MERLEAKKLHVLYREELLENVAPFWLENAVDRAYGGTFSCLDRQGKVYDTDKFAWMQGRAIWGFSMLYNQYGPKDAWLEAAASGVDFMKKHAFSESGDVYFSMDRKGNPLVAPYNIFSESFLCTGLAEYYRASGDAWAKEESLRAYQRFQARKDNPKGIWTKPIPGARALCPMNMQMIQFMMYREMQGIVPEELLRQVLDESIRLFFARHVDREGKRMLERVLPDGGHLFENMEGRLMTPGHALEALWFLMDVANGLGDMAMVQDIADIMLWVIESSWDTERGGIPLYMDALGMPVEKLESNQRHWWVHAEALAAFLLAHHLTGSPVHLAWFRKIHNYCFEHFHDDQYGEWYAYLDRYGDPEFTVKGSKWKTLYHLPRALALCEGILKEMSEA